MDYVNQVLQVSSVTSKAEVVSTSERGKTLIVLYFFLFTSFILNDFLRSNGEGVNDEAFSFRLSIIELLEVLCGALGDLPPLNVSSFSAKSIIGLKFLSVSFREMVLTRSPFSVPMGRGHTGSCKKIPACLNYPALFLPTDLGSQCTANQP